MGCARKCLALVTVLYLFGGVLDLRVPGARGGLKLLGASRTPGQSDALSPKAQGQVQKQDTEPAGPKSLSAVSQAKSGGIREPPFLRHSFLFDPDSAKLSAESQSAVKRVAAWLGQHPDVRILVVGFCDSSGSETCTPSLSERRGAVVCQWLVRFGVLPHQIAGVQGWSTADRDCRADIAKCQQVNRSAEIFIAGSAGSLK
jgi:outer membrane protein OmpA-like peptidoglycan-associated protein